MHHAHARTEDLFDYLENEGSCERADECAEMHDTECVDASSAKTNSAPVSADAVCDLESLDDETCLDEAFADENDYYDDYEGDQIVYCEDEFEDDEFESDEGEADYDSTDSADLSATPSYTYEELLDLQGSFIYRFKGHSMEPMLDQSEDLVVIERRPEGRLNRYDVVLFKRPTVKRTEYVLHRIIEVCEEGYQCAGDNEYQLEFVSEEQIIGVLSAYIHQNKRIPVTDPEYLEYVHQWCDHFDLRCKVLKAREKFRSIKHKLKI